jgi:nucleoside-diphosphate-sugar epimerase
MVKKTNALVTGGSGFLGQHLVQQLVDSGKWDVTVFDIRDAKVAGAKTIIGELAMGKSHAQLKGLLGLRLKMQPNKMTNNSMMLNDADDVGVS